MARHKQEPTEKVESSLVDTLTITCKGSRTTSKLLELGQYDFVDGQITDEFFPLKAHAPEQHVLEFIGFSEGFQYKAALSRVFRDFERRGLEKTTLEDALEFTIQYPWKDPDTIDRMSSVDHVRELQTCTIIFPEGVASNASPFDRHIPCYWKLTNFKRKPRLELEPSYHLYLFSAWRPVFVGLRKQ